MTGWRRLRRRAPSCHSGLARRAPSCHSGLARWRPLCHSGCADRRIPESAALASWRGIPILGCRFGRNDISGWPGIPALRFARAAMTGWRRLRRWAPSCHSGLARWRPLCHSGCADRRIPESGAIVSWPKIPALGCRLGRNDISGWRGIPALRFARAGMTVWGRLRRPTPSCHSGLARRRPLCHPGCAGGSPHVIPVAPIGAYRNPAPLPRGLGFRHSAVASAGMTFLGGAGFRHSASLRPE